MIVAKSFTWTWKLALIQTNRNWVLRRGPIEGRNSKARRRSFQYPDARHKTSRHFAIVRFLRGKTRAFALKAKATWNPDCNITNTLSFSAAKQSIRMEQKPHETSTFFVNERTQEQNHLQRATQNTRLDSNAKHYRQGSWFLIRPNLEYILSMHTALNDSNDSIESIVTRYSPQWLHRMCYSSASSINVNYPQW